jgi:DNA mismatch repair ATPase MutS
MRPAVARILPEWLETWVQLEALVCLANYAGLNLQAAFAEIDPQATPVFQADCLSHPLIHAQRATPNDFSISSLGELALITGSNMAGKSTFIKAVGINLCLAYAGGPVMARSLRCRPFRLHTCIRITDSIEDGISYFYAEVKRLRSLLAELQAVDPRPVLYLIDEIFRGTNNRERLAGSRAYLHALSGSPGVGLIATHDLELAHLAEVDRRVQNFHFRDEVKEGILAFDFLIRPGPSPTTNALKIMALEGLPVPEDYS